MVDGQVAAVADGFHVRSRAEVMTRPTVEIQILLDKINLD
jgi:hypothetical protein